MALFSGALDERIALTVAQESGGGGNTAWRYANTEPSGSVEGVYQTSHDWFREFLDKFMKGQTNLSQKIAVFPASYATIDYARWT